MIDKKEKELVRDVIKIIENSLETRSDFEIIQDVLKILERRV